MKQAYEHRPVLKPVRSIPDYFLEAIALLGLLACWILPLIVFQKLPDTIPTHYGLNGQVDDWGSKWSIFILPFINLFLFTGLRILSLYPNIYNYPVKVNEENALDLYTKGSRLIRIINMIIVLVFLFIEWQICHVTANTKLPSWFLPLVIVIPIVLPVTMALALTKKSSSVKPS
ncbi:MAG: DUF1648 domain-containing protein [Bacteroidota bacterium]